MTRCLAVAGGASSGRANWICVTRGLRAAPSLRRLWEKGAIAIDTDVPATLRDLVQRFPSVGRVDAIVLRPVRHQPAVSVAEAQAEPGLGLVGDRRSDKQREGDAARKRELTLIQAEHLPLIASWCGLDAVDATQVRRNLVISGLNLLSMRSPFRDFCCHWQIGDSAVIEVTGSCDPCSRMEVEVGFGAYNTMRGHGGLTALIVVGGMIRVGDSVRMHDVVHAPASLQTAMFP